MSKPRVSHSQLRSNGEQTSPRASQPQAAVRVRVAEASVLRGVALDELPRLLARGGVAQAAASSAIDRALAPSGGAGTDAARFDATPTTREGAPEAYERGFTAGHEAGYAAAAEDARMLGTQQGHREGFERGLQEGREQALDAARRAQEALRHEVAQRLATLDRLLASLPGQITARLQACEDDMVALCHAIVCRILGDTLARGDGPAKLVRTAVAACIGERAPAAGDAMLTAIHVHPRDLAHLCADESLAAWLAPRLADGASAHDAAVPWVADETVELGGCIVRSTEGSLDARLATQLTALTQWLARAHGAATQSDDGQVER